eukprot:403335562
MTLNNLPGQNPNPSNPFFNDQNSFDNHVEGMEQKFQEALSGNPEAHQVFVNPSDGNSTQVSDLGSNQQTDQSNSSGFNLYNTNTNNFDFTTHWNG